jgi:hypothetical protein
LFIPLSRRTKCLLDPNQELWLLLSLALRSSQFLLLSQALFLVPWALAPLVLLQVLPPLEFRAGLEVLLGEVFSQFSSLLAQEAMVLPLSMESFKLLEWQLVLEASVLGSVARVMRRAVLTTKTKMVLVTPLTMTAAERKGLERTTRPTMDTRSRPTKKYR